MHGLQARSPLMCDVIEAWPSPESNPDRMARRRAILPLFLGLTLVAQGFAYAQSTVARRRKPKSTAPDSA